MLFPLKPSNHIIECLVLFYCVTGWMGNFTFSFQPQQPILQPSSIDLWKKPAYHL